MRLPAVVLDGGAVKETLSDDGRLADTLVDGDTEDVPLAAMERDVVSDAEKLGVADKEAVCEGDCVTLRPVVSETDAEGETVAERVADAVAETETERLRDAATDRDADRVAVGVSEAVSDGERGLALKLALLLADDEKVHTGDGSTDLELVREVDGRCEAVADDVPVPLADAVTGTVRLAVNDALLLRDRATLPEDERLAVADTATDALPVRVPDDARVPDGEALTVREALREGERDADTLRVVEGTPQAAHETFTVKHSAGMLASDGHCF